MHTHEHDQKKIDRAAEQAFRQVNSAVQTAVMETAKCAPVALFIAVTGAAAALKTCATLAGRTPENIDPDNFDPDNIINRDNWLYTSLVLARAFEPHSEGLHCCLGPVTFVEAAADFERLTGRSPEPSLAIGLVKMMHDGEQVSKSAADRLMSKVMQERGNRQLN